ncbi:MAG: hypothetical protein JST39_06355 [Bacteroidetes bacterium]|nr:hypothetical protein [Bacteroidota bacterium]
MQYISPLHVIEVPAGSTPDKKDILLAKKKLLAELELNDGQSVDVNGKSFSKNDIIRFFDDLQQASDLSWHNAIYQDKVLLRFLEYNILEKNDRFADNPLYQEPAFIDWIGPYYSHSFTTCAGLALNGLSDDEWTALLENPPLMNSYRQELAWEEILKKLDRDTELLEFYGKQRMTKSGLKKVAPLCDLRYIMMLERLPAERFLTARNAMAFAIMQVCISAFNHTDKSWARNTIENAHILAVSEELKKQIYSKKYEMESISGGNGSSGKLQLWTVLRIAIFVLFIASRIGTCNDSNSNYSNYTPTYIRPSDSLRNMMRRLDTLNMKNGKLLSDSETIKRMLDKPAPGSQ